MEQGIRVTSSGKGKGIAIVTPTLTAAHEAIVEIDVKNDLRRGFERE